MQPRGPFDQGLDTQSAMGGGTSQILEDSSDSLSGSVGGSDIQQRSPLQVSLCLHTV